MDRKGSRLNRTRADRSKKRRAPPNPKLMENDTSFSKKSAEKLKDNRSVDTPVNPSLAYCFLEFVSVFAAISNNVACKLCHEEIKFSQTSKRGVGFSILMECKCGEETISSCPKINYTYEINRRLVFALRLLGVGREGFNQFCGLMDMGAGMSSKMYEGCMENINIAASAVYETVLGKVMNKEKELNAKHGNDESTLMVLGDCTVRRRGFSLIGVSTVLGHYTKKVIDAVVKSGSCLECGKEQKGHEEKCSVRNELNELGEMFGHSKEKHGVTYKKYLDSEDHDTVKGVLDTCLSLFGAEEKTYFDTMAVLGVILFNGGYHAILKTMNVMGISLGTQSQMYGDLLDEDYEDLLNDGINDQDKGAKKMKIVDGTS